jgi:hypothetical protein
MSDIRKSLQPFVERLAPAWLGWGEELPVRDSSFTMTILR